MTYHPGTIYRKQINSSGQLMKVSTGCTIHDENISKSTAITTLKNHGITVVSTSGVRTIQDPVKGCHKTIIFTGSSKPLRVRSNSATINNTTFKVISVTFTSSARTRGLELNLYALSTAKWYVGLGPTVTAAGGVTVTLASAS